MGRGQRGARADWFAPIGREDEGRSHRRGVRLPGIPYPAAILAWSARQASGLCLPIQEGTRLRDGEDQVAYSPQQASNARRSALPAQPGIAGLVYLFPPRCQLAHIRIRQLLRHLAGSWLDAQATQRAELGHPTPTPPPRLGHTRWQSQDVPTPTGRYHAIPLPGNTHRDTLGGHRMNPRRAGYAETCTSGSGGGPRKRTSRKAGTAPRPDPYRLARNAAARGLPVQLIQAD